MLSLSQNLDNDEAQPYFIWDIPITVAGLRDKLTHPDARERVLWMGRIMREATYSDVWRFLTVDQVLDHYPMVQRHLGRRRRFWDFLIEGWRHDKLI